MGGTNTGCLLRSLEEDRVPWLRNGVLGPRDSFQPPGPAAPLSSGEARSPAAGVQCGLGTNSLLPHLATAPVGSTWRSGGEEGGARLGAFSQASLQRSRRSPYRRQRRARQRTSRPTSRRRGPCKVSRLPEGSMLRQGCSHPGRAIRLAAGGGGGGGGAQAAVRAQAGAPVQEQLPGWGRQQSKAKQRPCRRQLGPSSASGWSIGQLEAP